MSAPAAPHDAAAAAQLLKPELEYRLRLILQEAWKFCRRARRYTLTGADIYEGWKLVCGEVPSHGRPAAASVRPPDDVPGLSFGRAMLQPGIEGFEQKPFDLPSCPPDDIAKLLQAVRLGVRNLDADSTVHMIEALASAESQGHAPAVGRLLAAIIGILHEEAELAAHQALPRRQAAVVRVLRGLAAVPAAAAALGDALSTLISMLIAPEGPLPIHVPLGVTAARVESAVAWGREQRRVAATQRVSEQVALRGEAAQCLLDMLCGSAAVVAPLPPGAVMQAVELFLRVLALAPAHPGAAAVAGTESGAAADLSALRALECADDGSACGGEPRKRPRLDPYANASATAPDGGAPAQIASSSTAALAAAAPRVPPSAHAFGALCGLKLFAAAALPDATTAAASAVAATWVGICSFPGTIEPGAALAEQEDDLLATLWAPHCLQQASAVLRAVDYAAGRRR